MKYPLTLSCRTPGASVADKTAASPRRALDILSEMIPLGDPSQLPSIEITDADGETVEWDHEFGGPTTINGQGY